MLRINKKGFTFVELLIIVILIIVLSGAGLYFYQRISFSQKQKLVKANIALILEALDRYKEKNGAYPANQYEFDRFLETNFKEIPRNPFWTPGTDSTIRYGWLYVKLDDKIEIYALQK